MQTHTHNLRQICSMMQVWGHTSVMSGGSSLLRSTMATRTCSNSTNSSTTAWHDARLLQSNLSNCTQSDLQSQHSTVMRRLQC